MALGFVPPWFAQPRQPTHAYSHTPTRSIHMSEHARDSDPLFGPIPGTPGSSNDCSDNNDEPRSFTIQSPATVRERVKRYATLLPALVGLAKKPRGPRLFQQKHNQGGLSFGASAAREPQQGGFSLGCVLPELELRNLAPALGTTVDAVYVAGGFLLQCATEEGTMRRPWPGSDIDYWVHVRDPDARLPVAEIVRLVAPDAKTVCVNKCTMRITLKGDDETQHNIIFFGGPAHEVPTNFDMDCVKASYEATSDTLSYTPEFLEAVKLGVSTLAMVPFDKLTRESRRRVRKYEARGFRYPVGGVVPAKHEGATKERAARYTMCGRSALETTVALKPMPRVGCGNYFRPAAAADKGDTPPPTRLRGNHVTPSDISAVKFKRSGDFHVSTNFTGVLENVELVRIFENDKNEAAAKSTRRYLFRLTDEQQQLMTPFRRGRCRDTVYMVAAPRHWTLGVRPGDKLNVAFRLLTPVSGRGGGRPILSVTQLSKSA